MGPADADKRSHPLRCSFEMLKGLDERLEQLEFAARQFLHLDTNEDAQAAPSRFPEFDSPLVHVRPGLQLHQRLADRRVGIGGRELHANVLHCNQHAVFIAIESTDDDNRPVVYYAQLVLCFSATYLNDAQPLCYVRWLHTARAVAQGRALTDAETRGPFDAYRWAVYPLGRVGHPRKGGPWYGVVHASKVMYRVHMVRSLHDQTLFRLNTDVWYEYL